MPIFILLGTLFRDVNIGGEHNKAVAPDRREMTGNNPPTLHDDVTNI